MRAIRVTVISICLTLALSMGFPAHAAVSPPISGSFVADVDFSTVRLKDMPHNTCLLTISGVLTFTGSLVGSAPGTTNALEQAPCTDVAANPPGTYFDVFQFRGRFAGTVDGRPVSGTITYTGVTNVGGHIDAVIVLWGSGIGPLRADAIVAQGGSYSG
jgi:hypothetical protein